MRLACIPFLALIASCGGGGSPLDNPPDVNNGGGGGNSSGTLSFEYFQKCINPLVTTNADPNKNCSNSGCHADTGSGGAYRALSTATDVPLPVAAPDVATVQLTDMFKNFHSARAQATLSNPDLSKLLLKPLNDPRALHRPGQVIDPGSLAERRIRFWIANPLPSDALGPFYTGMNHILFDQVSGACIPIS